jgi:hypothetical protein
MAYAPGPAPPPATPSAPEKPVGPSAPDAPKGAAALSDIQRKLAATVLAESAPDGTQDEKVAWVYFTFVRRNGEQALAKSNAYRLKQLWFRVWMVALGDATYAKDKDAIPGYSKDPVPLKDYVASGGFQKLSQKRGDAMADTVRSMYASPERNPYKDVTNQGSAGYDKASDFNRSDEPWRTARLYYWLLRCGALVDPPQGLTVEIITAKRPEYQTVLFNTAALDAYFKKHPEQRRKNVEAWTAESNRTPPCTPPPAAKGKAKPDAGTP